MRKSRAKPAADIAKTCRTIAMLRIINLRRPDIYVRARDRMDGGVPPWDAARLAFEENGASEAEARAMTADLPRPERSICTEARNPIADSMSPAPPDQTVADWARTDVEVRALLLFRELTPERRETFLQAGRRMAAGMPPREAALLGFQECGMSEAEVAEAMAGLPVPVGEG